MSSILPLPRYAKLAERCIRPLCFGAPGDEYYGLSMFEIEAGSDRRPRNIQLGLQGSCTLISYRNHYFVVFTRHQIAMVPNESSQAFRTRMELLHVLMDDGRESTNLPINGFLFAFDVGDDEDDFVVGLVEEPMLTDFMRARFFPVTRAWTGMVNDQALCAGFPSHLQRVLMQKDGLRTLLVCKHGVVVRRMSRSTATVEYGDDDQRMDGMSGGAVFVCQLHRNLEVILFIDGIVQRAGSGYLRHLTIERALDRIDGHFEGSPS